MKRPTFSETVDVLVKAYLNDTLIQGSPCGCAIGNLIADKLGKKVNIVDSRSYEANWDGDDREAFDWFLRLRPGRVIKQKDLVPDFNNGDRLIRLTGYTLQEVGRIEYAFEDNDDSFRYNSDSARFQGLMRVVEVLADIHGIDLQTKESAKLLFVKA
jgi:hypothetical protein